MTDAVFDNDRVEFFAYDDLWRLRAVYARDPGQTTATCRERYAYNPAGLNGKPTSAPLDSPVFGQIDAAGDGTFERSFLIIQNHLGDVIKIIGEGGFDEEIRYTLFGEPYIVNWCADVNHDGSVDGEDIIAFYTLWDIGAFDADSNQNGAVDGDDIIAFFAYWDNGDGAGRTLADNRFGFRGYVWDDHLKLYHVRHRVYDPTPGPAGMRWLQRDPAFFVDGLNLYAYCGGDPVNGRDPMGLDTWWAGSAARFVGADSLGDFVDDAVDGTASVIDHITGNPYAENAHWVQEMQNTASRQWNHAQSCGDSQLGQAFSNRLNSGVADAMLMDSVETELAFASYSVATAAIPVGSIASAAASTAVGKAANVMITSAAVRAAEAAVGQTALRSVAASAVIRASSVRFALETAMMRGSGQIAREAGLSLSTRGAPAAEHAAVDRLWKLKIQGSPQQTSPGHAFRTYREAIREAKNPDVLRVHIDHGYNRALRLKPKTISPNRRPDVISVYRDRTVRRVEVKSPSDTWEELRRRNSDLDPQIRDAGYNPTSPFIVEPH